MSPLPTDRAPGEVYRDPVYDGATDPTVVRAPEGWWMFYTQRRATHPTPGPGVAWVHGSRIGIAQPRFPRGTKTGRGSSPPKVRDRLGQTRGLPTGARSIPEYSSVRIVT